MRAPCHSPRDLSRARRWRRQRRHEPIHIRQTNTLTLAWPVHNAHPAGARPNPNPAAPQTRVAGRREAAVGDVPPPSPPLRHGGTRQTDCPVPVGLATQRSPRVPLLARKRQRRPPTGLSWAARGDQVMTLLSVRRRERGGGSKARHGGHHPRREMNRRKKRWRCGKPDPMSM